MSWEVRIRAFRSGDDIKTRDLYHSGLEQVLLYYGITRVTSLGRDWFDNDQTWIVVAESLDGSQLLGGSRMQMATEEFQLPIEKAIAFKDPIIYYEVDQYRANGAGELCGMWNSRKVAGMGLGSIFLGISALAIAPKIGMNTVFSLCAPSTKSIGFKLGFSLNSNLGNNGEFIYPKENLVATAMIMTDPGTVSNAAEFEQTRILALQKNPKTVADESTQRGDLKIYYEL